MPSKPEAPPELIRVADDTLVMSPLNEPTWEPHPDRTGGYRPIDPAKRGAIELPCPACGAKLVREAGRTITANSSFGCPEPCGARFLGAELFAKERQAREGAEQ
jgi:hypothetical protein